MRKDVTHILYSSMNRAVMSARTHFFILRTITYRAKHNILETELSGSAITSAAMLGSISCRK